MIVRTIVMLGCAFVCMFGAQAAQARPAARAVTAVALLPLDAPDRLAIYGQPVAAEIASGLRATGVQVDVVGPGAPVPTRALLVIDGNIARGAGTVIILRLRVRDPLRGIDLERVVVEAASLTAIDQAVATLVGQLVPLVQAHLVPQASPPEPRKPPPTPVAVPIRAPLYATITGAAGADATALAAALRTPLAHLAAALERRIVFAPPSTGSTDDRAWIELDVLAVVSATTGRVPLSRPRVRARLHRGDALVRTRVAHTDTLIGARDATTVELAASVGRQVVDIVVPHVRAVLAGAP